MCGPRPPGSPGAPEPPVPPTSYGSKLTSPNWPLCSRCTKATCSSVSRMSCPVIRSCTVRLGGRPSEPLAPPSAPPLPPTGGPTRLTSSQGRPFCPGTGPARPGCARAYRCACHPGRSPRAGSRRTTPGARCPPCSAHPGAAGQHVSPGHPLCPPLPSSRPGQMRGKRESQRTVLEAAPRHPYTCPSPEV